MSIYTKTGDGGITSLYGGQHVLKSDPQINAIGTIDELTSFIGLILCDIQDKEHIDLFSTIQKKLLFIMGALSGAPTKTEEFTHIIQLTQHLENTIDGIEKKLPKLHTFIIPGGAKMSCLLHVARTICRRTERAVIKHLHNEKSLETKESKIIISFLNRLSDLLFMLARQYNTDKEVVI